MASKTLYSLPVPFVPPSSYFLITLYLTQLDSYHTGGLTVPPKSHSCSNLMALHLLVSWLQIHFPSFHKTCFKSVSITSSESPFPTTSSTIAQGPPVSLLPSTLYLYSHFIFFCMSSSVCSIFFCLVIYCPSSHTGI